MQSNTAASKLPSTRTHRSVVYVTSAPPITQHTAPLETKRKVLLPHGCQQLPIAAGRRRAGGGRPRRGRPRRGSPSYQSPWRCPRRGRSRRRRWPRQEAHRLRVRQLRRLEGGPRQLPRALVCATPSSPTHRHTVRTGIMPLSHFLY